MLTFHFPKNMHRCPGLWSFQYSWKSYFASRYANCQLLIFSSKFTLTTCSVTINWTPSISPWKCVKLVGHRPRELRQYSWRKGLLLVPGAALGFFLLRLCGPSMVCVWGHLVGLCPRVHVECTHRWLHIPGRGRWLPCCSPLDADALCSRPQTHSSTPTPFAHPPTLARLRSGGLLPCSQAQSRQTDFRKPQPHSPTRNSS